MSIYLDGNYIAKSEDAVIPHPEVMRKFIEKLEKEIINEMNLGYKSLDDNSQVEYFKTLFKKDLESLK